MDFRSKTIIITGASSGIGKATALMAYERGANIAVVARRGEELSALCSSLSTLRYEIIPADVTIEAGRKQIVETTISHFGGIDVLVNAAGIIGFGSIENTTLEQWDTMLDVNLRSLFRLTQLALPSIIQRKGNIVNVSSVTGIRSFPRISIAAFRSPAEKTRYSSESAQMTCFTI